MPRPESSREVQKYKSQTRYIFAHVDSGNVLHQFTEESFTPVPEEGSRVIVGNTLARSDGEGHWNAVDQESFSFIVTDVEYEYNKVHFESEDGAAQRLITQVWIFGMPITEPPAEDEKIDQEE